MASDISLQVTTGYQGSGMKAATQDMKNYGDQINKTANEAGTNFEGLFKRIERPLGVIAFSGIANELTNMGQKGENATVMLEHGLHAAGSALMFFNPLLGIGVIAATALFEAFHKDTQAGTELGDAIAKEAEEADKSTKSNKDYADSLLRQGLITKQQAKDIDLLTAQQRGKTDNDLAQLLVTKNIAEAQLRLSKTGVAVGLSQKQIAEVMEGGLNVQKKYDDALMAYTTGYGPQAVKTEQEQTSALEKKYKALIMTLDANSKVIEQTKLKQQFGNIDLQLTNKIIQMENETVQLTQKLARTKSIVEQKQLQTHIEYNNKEVQSDKQLLNQKKTLYSQMAQEINQYTSAFASAWSVSNGKVLFNSGKFASEMIGKFAKMYATVLAMEAAKDIGVGNYGGAAVAIAESAIVESLGSIAGGLLSGGGSSSAPSSGGSNSTLTGNSGGSTNSQGNGSGTGINATFIVQGGSVSPNMMQEFASNLNDWVQSKNGQVIATHYVSNGGTVTALG